MTKNALTSQKSVHATRQHVATMPFFQAKLSVNQPGDVYEQEADRVADQVMRRRQHPESSFFSAQPPVIQRKCAACEEEEKVQRREQRASDTPVEATDLVQQTLSAGGGAPLSDSTRQMMESGIGHDFSQVRIHTGAQASASAKSIQAKAYTSGNQIVFDEGAYRPDTLAGQHLLAHELTHVVQQGGGIQRSVNHVDFEIRGLFPQRGQPRFANFIFFNMDDPGAHITPPELALDPDERTKIENKTREILAQGAAIRNITLYGFASEEGNTTENENLVGRRLRAVQNVIRSSGYSGTVVWRRRPRQGVGDQSYQFWRAVEIEVNGAATSRDARPAEHRTCTTDEQSRIATARTNALNHLNGGNGLPGAIPMLNDYIANQAAHQGIVPHLDHYFSDHALATAQQVRDNLVAVAAYVNSGSTIACGTDSAPTCIGGVAYNSAGRQITTVCRRFFEDPDLQTHALIHESFHGALRLRDRAYGTERVFRFMTTAQALTNADSATLFVRAVNGATAAALHGEERTASPDTIDGCGARTADVDRAISWAARWNTYAMFGSAQVYDNREATMISHIMRHFGGVEARVLAGISHRFSLLETAFDVPWRINCLNPNDPLCMLYDPVELEGPGSLSVCPEFFTRLDRNREDAVRLIYLAICRSVSDIPSYHYHDYVQLAYEFMNDYWQVTNLPVS